MTVYALWSAARSRSTAFFRSMLARQDLLALHEPLEGLVYIGPLEIESEHFESPQPLIDWLLDSATQPVFMKETVSRPVVEAVVANERFLAEAQHAFLIRRPEEIAASFWALEGDMRIYDTGVEALHELYLAVREAGGHQPVVIDSEDLVTQPEATMRAYSAAAGLEFLEHALSWDEGVQPQWQRTARWHEDASASTGFFRPAQPDRHSLESHPEVVRFAERHRPFYEKLRAERLHIPQ